MHDTDAALQALTEQMQTLQRDMTQQLMMQQQTIAHQEAALAALQAEVETAKRNREVSSAAATRANGRRAPKTSRRHLLTTAGTAAAAVTAGVVALGANANVAHAATGGTFILGETNDAGASTILNPTGGTTPSRLLLVNNFSGGGDAISGYGTPGDSGVSGYMSGSAGGNGIYGQAATTGNGVQGQALGNNIGVFGQSGSGVPASTGSAQTELG
jgi:hypothetical protein